MRAFFALTGLLILIGATSAPSSAPSGGSSRTVWDGVYTAEQAERGAKAYNSLCARCHGEKLLGNDDAPQLVDKEFLSKWQDKSVGDLVTLTQKSMPSDGPGKLSRKQCTDIIAYLLKSNDFPAGSSELMPEAESLSAILIQPKK